MGPEANEQRHPVVFISYSHDSPEHADRVLALSDRLREDGIDSILDRYEDSPPEGWPKWMDRNVRDADFVLVICTERYYKRVMDEEKPATGQGVRWESTLVYQHLYNADTKNTKFIPVLFEGGQVSHVPTPLQGATHYRLDADDGYESLYRRLTNQPRVQKPELGKLKRLPPVEARSKKQDFALAAQGLWPNASLPRGGPKVTEPFAGREEELKELTAAMSGDEKVVAVVGMAGQGKSCLIGEWYKRGARPPQRVGLFWRKVYGAGYTFDRLMDDLHLYFTGEQVDRTQVRTIQERTALVEGLLANKPCWIVLDGVERWLKRWMSDPDADAENPTGDDRAGHDPALDEFLKGASFWENESRLLLTTRAVPSPLDENPPVLVGRTSEPERRLSDLKADDAVRLLEDLNVKGPKEVKLEAVSAYACHAYAVHVLGVLLRDLYGGDVSHWREVNPLQESKLAGLFERILATCQEDVPLLELVACSLGPAPVEMLVDLTGRGEISIRQSLAGLKKWQMVDFEGPATDQHTVVRKFLSDRLGQEAMRASQRRIAAWWARCETPAYPTRIDEIRPHLRAIEHLVAARDFKAATTLLFTQLPQHYYNMDDWLRVFGYLDDAISIHKSIIDACVNLIQKGGRCELREDLAACYNSRGNVLRAQGRLSEAIADYGRAIQITADLVQHESRGELRSDLARRYSNRGTALYAQGALLESVADHDQAIRIAEELVNQEGHGELRVDLAGYYNNRGITLARGHLSEAVADYNRAIGVAEELVLWEGQRGLRDNLGMCYNNRGLALADQGHLEEAIADYGRAMKILEEPVGQEGRSEWRHMLAMCHNNRGLALARQGHLQAAITDHARAIQIYEGLVQREGRRELRDELAAFYNNRAVASADQDSLREAISDYNRAIEIREELVEREGQAELRNALAICYNNRGAALARQERLDEAMSDYDRAIRIRDELVFREGRRDVRNDLALSYIGRGVVLRSQKRLSEAATDCSRAIEIEKTLVEQEGRYELRNDLAKGYVGRGLAWTAQGRPEEAVADYDRAIEIQERLVEQENRREPRGDLAQSLFNRAVALKETGDWQRANLDIEKGTVLLQRVIEEGQRHVLASLLHATDFRCRYAKELGGPLKTVQAANEIMRWFIEEVEQNRATLPLLRTAGGLTRSVQANRRFLLRHGLDEALWRRFQVSLAAATREDPS